MNTKNLFPIIEDAIRDEYNCMFNPPLIIDEDIDTEIFVEEHCVAQGKVGIAKHLADVCIKEFDRRIGMFACGGKEAFRFIADVIIKHIASWDCTPKNAKNGLSASLADMLQDLSYVVVEVSDSSTNDKEIYLFDFTQVGFDWRKTIHGYDTIRLSDGVTDEWGETYIDFVKREMEKHAKTLENNYIK